MARHACGFSAQRLAEISGTSQAAISAFELAYLRPENSHTAPLLRYALEKCGVEFIGDDTVRYPREWNPDLQSAMRPYQRELRRLEKLRGRVRRLELRDKECRG
jgi:hypothetical protein